MNTLGSLINRMVQAGLSAGEAGAIAAEIYAAGVASASVRSSGAERTRRWRNNKASQTVTKRHAVTPDIDGGETSPNVTERHKPSQSDATTVSPIDTKIKNSKRQNSERSSRGTRLAPDWVPTDVDKSAAKQEGLSEFEISKEALRFRDYWIGRAGSGGVKLDWSATWRNWIRTAAEKLGRTPLSSSSMTVETTGFLAEFGSAELDAWDDFGRKTRGKTFPRNKHGGWRFPTRWPPGYLPDAPQKDTPVIENRS